MASPLARPPALRITWASPSARPAYFAGSRRASIQVRIAKRRLGGSAILPLSPKFSAYLAFAASTSSRILVIAFASCSELSQRVGYQEKYWCRATSPFVALSSAAEPPHKRHGSVQPNIPVPSRDVAPAATRALLRAIPSATPRRINSVHCGQF